MKRVPAVDDPAPVVDLAAWRPTEPAARGTSRIVIAVSVALAVPSIVAAYVGGAPLGCLSLLVLGGTAWTYARRHGRRVVKSLGGRRADAEARRRLFNLTEGLQQRLQIPAVRLWEIEDGRKNAMVFTDGGPGIAVTTGMLDSSTRTELEGVVAHCLARWKLMGGWRVALLGAFPFLAPRVGLADDVNAASVTRYPPGLAAAISNADPMDRAPFLWFVGSARTHENTAFRVAQLLDL